MIVLTDAYARCARTLPDSELERLARRLPSLADQAARLHFGDRYSTLRVDVAARVELGSTRTWIVVTVLTQALISYGGIRQSVDYLINDGKQVGRLMRQAVSHLPALKLGAAKSTGW